MRFVIISFLVWRVLLFLPLFIGNQILPYKSESPYTNIWYFTKQYEPVSSPLLYPWSNFDGIHYLSIAGEGYRDNERFFPLYPALIKIFSFNQPVYSTILFFAGLLASNLAFLVAIIYFYKLLVFDYTGNTAKHIILAMLVFPTAFFFASLYTESLFLMLAVLSMYLARKRKWFFASISAAFLIITRIIGIAIIPALAYEFWKAKEKPQKALSFFLPVISFCGFLLFNMFQFGNPFQFLINQREVATNRELFIFPLQTIYRYIKILTTLPVSQYEWWIALLEVSVFFVVCALLYVAWKKKVRTSYLIFAFFSFLLPVVSGTFSSLPRYALILFPIYIAISLLKNSIVKALYFAISPILLFLLTLLFSRGYFVS